MHNMHTNDPCLKGIRMLSPRPKSNIQYLVSLFKNPVSPLDAIEKKEEVKEVKLERFVAKPHFSLVDTGIHHNETPLQSLAFSQTGLDLIAQYYSEKYQATIFFISEKKINYAELLKNMRKIEAKNVRAACIIKEMPPSQHFIPLIYIKENGEEALLVADH
jgi:hypothetical protein